MRLDSRLRLATFSQNLSRPGALCLSAFLCLASFQFLAPLGRAQSVATPARPAPVSQGIRDSHGSTPLIAAAASGDAGMVKALVAAGASVDATDVRGRTALIVAAESNKPEAVKALVAAGASLNVEANYIGSALNLAENNGNTELAAFLLAAGAHSTGKSVGDMVCVRPWGGEGYCGTVKAFTVKAVQLSVTRLVGCTQGCAARQECSAANPVGGVNGLHVGEAIEVPSWCLTDTAVKQ